MSKLVYFKFKSSLAQYEIPFEGSCISVKELCQAIRKKCSITNYDLVITLKDTNSQIEKECSENDFIPAFSNVIVKRMPLKDPFKYPPIKKTINPENFNKIDPYKNMNENGVGSLFKKINMDSADLTEEQKLDNIIENAGANLKLYCKKPLTGNPPPSYTCNKCNIPGHWINNCPGIPDKNGKLVDSRLVKRPSGIPVCGLTEVDENTPNSYLTPDGRYVVNIKNREAFLKGKKDKRPFSLEENPPLIENPKNDIPNELQCKLCSKLIDAPTKTGCCAMTYCRICITDYLFDPEKSVSMHKCPNCMSVIDKLDKLIDDAEREKQIMIWKFNKFSSVIEEKSGEPTEDIKQETNVTEMTDDDLLNEIFSMNNKENDQPINENLNHNIMKIEENFNKSEIPLEKTCVIQSSDETTAEIIKELASNNCAQGIYELMKTNPKAIEVIQGIINHLKPMENSNRSDNRSRSRPRYDNRQRNSNYNNNDYYHSTRYESRENNQRYSRPEEDERKRRRSSESRDSFRKYKNEEKPYFHLKRETKYADNHRKYSNYSPENRNQTKIYSENSYNKNQKLCDRETEQNEEKQYSYQKDSDCKREKKYIDDSKKYSNYSPEYRNKSKVYLEDFHGRNQKSCKIETDQPHRRFKESNMNSEYSTRIDFEDRRYSTSHHKKYQDFKEPEFQERNCNEKHRDIHDKSSIYNEKSESRRSRDRGNQEKNREVRTRSPIIHQKSLEHKPISNTNELNEFGASQKKSKDSKSHKKHKKSKKNKTKHAEKKKHKKSKHLTTD